MDLAKMFFFAKQEKLGFTWGSMMARRSCHCCSSSIEESPGGMNGERRGLWAEKDTFSSNPISSGSEC